MGLELVIQVYVRHLPATIEKLPRSLTEWLFFVMEKIVTLSQYLAGEPFQLIVVDGSEVGVLAVPRENAGDEVPVWMGFSPKTTLVARERITFDAIELNVPDVYETVKTTVGGVGIHDRWKILIPLKYACTSVVLHGADDSLAQELCDLNLIHGIRESCDIDGTPSCAVDMNTRDIFDLQEKCAERNVTCFPCDERFVADMSVAPDRLDRRRSSMKSQNAESPCWREIPLSDWETCQDWESVVKYLTSSGVTIDDVQGSTGIERFERVLLDRNRCRVERRLVENEQEIQNTLGSARDEVRGLSAEERRSLDASIRVREELRSCLSGMGPCDNVSYVSSKLSSQQNKQLLQAWYLLNRGTGRKVETVCGLILFRALLHGWCVRVMGRYERSGKHIGFGVRVRNFKCERREEYDAQRDCVQVRNRLRVDDEGREEGIGRLRTASKRLRKK
jgi:hypothetical protein